MKTKFIQSVMALVILGSILITYQNNAGAQPLEGDLFNPLAAPTFTAGTRLQASGGDLKVDTYASVPCVVDWNGDGKKDLLVGCFYYGNVYLYLNSGTNSAPVFTTGTKLQAGGVDLSVAYG